MTEITMKIQVHINAGYYWDIHDEWEGFDLVSIRNSVDSDGNMVPLVIGDPDDADAVADALKKAAQSIRDRQQNDCAGS